MTVTLAKLADAAVDAREGADLFRFELADRIPDHAFKANGDGTVTIKGVEFLKTGTFNGLTLLDSDLVAMVEKFARLRDAGVFLPPFRIDHSWSVLSVIGYVTELSVARRTDGTDGTERLFLSGDVLLTGSVDYTPDVLVKAMKRGALRLRSSEIGWYVTNAGEEFPLVFYGVAFVDIPAVEGLAPVQLDRARHSAPHRITTLNATTEETHGMNPIKLARLKALRGLVAADVALSASGSEELADLETEASAAEVDDAAVEAADDADPDLSVLEDEAPAEDAPPAEDPPAETGAGEAAADAAQVPDDAGTGESEEVADLRRRATEAEAEAARLRTEQIEAGITALRERGAIVTVIEEDATALLRHADEDVRRRAGAILGNLAERVNLSRRPGRTDLERQTGGGPAGDDAPATIDLAMPGEEFGEWWAALESEQRAALRESGEYDKYLRHRADNGIRD